MNAIGDVLLDLQHGEARLADELLAVSDRHRTEHEIHHVAHDLERWSREHVRLLGDIVARYGQVPARSSREPAHLLSGARRKLADALGRRPEPGLLVLHDLRTLYLMASENSLHWEMLAQAAQARRDGDLLDLVTDCHPQTLRQVRWANTLIKTMSPQVLSSLTLA